MRYLFYLGHPAHFHLFKHAVAALKARGHEVEILIKTKDVLEDLLAPTGWPYRNILQNGRRDGKLSIAWSLLRRDLRVLHVARSFRPHLMLGTSAEIAHVGRLLGVPAVVVNEDDHDVVPLFAKLAYPFAHSILAPDACRVGRWADRTLRYAGYHELAYLHPAYFTPKRAVAERLRGEEGRYVILRFAQLNAHHDEGRTGIDATVARRLLRHLEGFGRVYITAERPLEPELEPNRIQIPPHEMHDALAGASLYVGDSQTMAAEAAVLGVPSVRFNDFVGEIGYLEELEHRYRLTVGIRTSQPQRLFETVADLVRRDDLRHEWKGRRARMLEETIDVTALLVRLAEDYPATRKALLSGAAQRANKTDLHPATAAA